MKTIIKFLLTFMLLVSTVSTLNGAVAPLSVANATQYVTNYTTMVNLYTAGLKTYSDGYTKYLALYNATAPGALKDAYLNSVKAYANAVTVYKSGLEMYTKRLADAKTQLATSIAYYQPAQIVPAVPAVPSYMTLTLDGVNYTAAAGDTSHILGTTSTEYIKTTQLSLIGATTAYNQGYTGKGVTIGIIDSGTSLNSGSDIYKKLTTTNVWDKSLSYTSTGGLKTYDVINQTRIDNIRIVKSTYKFIGTPIITLTGTGTGAQFYGKLNSDGTLNSILTVSHGSGYTPGMTVTITDSATGKVVPITTQVALGGQDMFGHGSYSSSVAAGAYDNNGIAGVAYDANVLIAKVGDQALSTADIRDAIAWMNTSKANVVNQSFEMSNVVSLDSYTTANYKAALANNVSFVTAAGNQGSLCTTLQTCNIYAALPLAAGNSDMLNQKGAWIVAGALNAVGTDIATYSNRAGLTKNFYLLAPGTVVGDNLIGGTATNTGTSFAAPIISGGLALLKQKWPQLSGSQQAQILFQTATDMGTTGVDDIYGWGKMDLNKAFNPIGSLKTVSLNGASINTASTSLSGNGVTASIASIAPLSESLSFDSFNREYSTNLVANTNYGTNFDFESFNRIPLTKNIKIGYNDYFKTLSLTYENDNIEYSYSNIGGVLGSKGTGALSYNGNTNYIGAKYSAVEYNTGFEISGQFGYATVSNSNESLISMSDVAAVGANVKYKVYGFGVHYSIPNYIVSGKVETIVPTTYDAAANNIGYTKTSTNLCNDNYERRVGILYEKNGLNITMDHTINIAGIAGTSSNDLKVSGIWYW